MEIILWILAFFALYIASTLRLRRDPTTGQVVGVLMEHEEEPTYEPFWPRGVPVRRIIGPRGFPGEPGPPGDPGDPGPPGPPGDPGSELPNGSEEESTPPKGEKGDPGEPGPTGDRGFWGPEWAQKPFPGLPGPKGDKGDRGFEGVLSMPGYDGDDGRKGASGKTGTDPGPPGIGLPGLPGKPGPRGAPGPKGKPTVGLPGTPVIGPPGPSYYWDGTPAIIIRTPGRHGVYAPGPAGIPVGQGPVKEPLVQSVPMRELVGGWKVQETPSSPKVGSPGQPMVGPPGPSQPPVPPGPPGPINYQRMKELQSQNAIVLQEAMREIAARNPSENLMDLRQGSPGGQGHTGTTGLAAVQGINGQGSKPGLSGQDGQMGSNALEGQPAQPGMMGVMGPPGTNAASGAHGAAGIGGAHAAAGVHGEHGTHGVHSAHGPHGVKGNAGGDGGTASAAMAVAKVTADKNLKAESSAMGTVNPKRLHDADEPGRTGENQEQKEADLMIKKTQLNSYVALIFTSKMLNANLPQILTGIQAPHFAEKCASYIGDGDNRLEKALAQVCLSEAGCYQDNCYTLPYASVPERCFGDAGARCLKYCRDHVCGTRTGLPGH